MGKRMGPAPRPAVDRFWAKVAGGQIDECWIWTGAHSRHGYGHFLEAPGKWTRAHRFAYTQLIDEIPEGLHLDHLCVNPPCVNPWHLDPVPLAVNSARYSERLMHCKHGHEFTPKNTRHKRLGRECKACDAARARAYRARIRASRFPDGTPPPGSGPGHTTTNTLLNLSKGA